MKFIISLILVIGVVILTMGLERANKNKVNYLKFEKLTQYFYKLDSIEYQQRWNGDTLIIEPFDSSLAPKDKYILLAYPTQNYAK